MRIAKLSSEEFADEAALVEFFDGLPNRNPPRLFLIKGQIRSDGLVPGETLLFTYRGHLRFVAQASTGRQNNTFDPRPDFPYCFVVNIATIRRTDLPINEVERQLQAAGMEQSLGGQGWTEIHSEVAERVIEALVPE